MLCHLKHMNYWFQYILPTIQLYIHSKAVPIQCTAVHGRVAAMVLGKNVVVHQLGCLCKQQPTLATASGISVGQSCFSCPALGVLFAIKGIVMFTWYVHTLKIATESHPLADIMDITLRRWAWLSDSSRVVVANNEEIV